jgi:copper chaperone
MSVETFVEVGRVNGMTCQHCVASVTEEVEGIPGTRRVRLDLRSGRLSLSADRRIDPSELRRAVAEAGYQLVLAR